MSELVLQFSTSTAFMSSMIRRLCHSEFSHCDIVTPDGLLGVSGVDKSIGDAGGVRVRRPGLWPYLRTPKTARLKTDVADKVIALGKTQLGKPFDDGALWEFLSDDPADRDWRDESKWFCSEFVAWCLETAGFFPYSLIAAKNRITPGDLLFLVNPVMQEDNIHEFNQ